MCNNDLNKAIYNELLKCANQYFTEIEENFFPGTYTLKDMVYNMDIEIPNSAEVFTIEIDSFRCSLAKDMIFITLFRFKTLAKVRENVTFVKADTSAHTAPLSITINIAKEHKELKNFIQTGAIIAKSLDCIYLDIRRKVLFASNGHKAIEMPADVNIITDELQSLDVIAINADIVSKCLGKITIDVTPTDENEYTTTATTADGRIYTNTFADLYNYTKVYPKLAKEGYFCISPDDVPSVVKSIKSFKKSNDVRRVIFDAPAGSDIITISFKSDYYPIDRQITAHLTAKTKTDIYFHLDPEKDYNALKLWSGGVWFTGSDKLLVFDSAAANLILIVPRYVGDGQVTRPATAATIPTLSRHAAPICDAPTAPQAPAAINTTTTLSSPNYSPMAYNITPYVPSKISLIFATPHAAQRHRFTVVGMAPPAAHAARPLIHVYLAHAMAPPGTPTPIVSAHRNSYATHRARNGPALNNSPPMPYGTSKISLIK